MWSFLDHLNALLLLSGVTLLFLAVQMGGQEAQIASTVRASGTGVYVTADWVERDLANLGDGMGDGEAAILDYAWGADAGRFTFRTGSDTTLATAATVVRYELVEGIDPDLRELHRYVIEGGTARLTARSSGTLRVATLTLLDAAGLAVPPDELDRARSVSIHLSMAPPLGVTEGALDWSRRFFPLHLAQNG